VRREEAEATFEAQREALVETPLELSMNVEELSVKPREQSAAMRELVDRVGELERAVDELERQAGRDSPGETVHVAPIGAHTITLAAGKEREPAAQNGSDAKNPIVHTSRDLTCSV